jgi:hypothetical protein
MKKSIMTFWMIATISFEFSAIGTVLSACLFYWQVVIDHWCRSAVVTHQFQSNEKTAAA